MSKPLTGTKKQTVTGWHASLPIRRGATGRRGSLPFAFRVDAPDVNSIRAPLAAAAPVESRPAAGAGTGAPVRGGARAEILAVIKDLVARSGRPEVTLVEIVDEMRRRGSAYAESTVHTMMSSHMCAQVHGPNIGSYDDLDRVGHGQYRLGCIAMMAMMMFMMAGGRGDQ
jgi:hypothetical protein